MPHRNVVQKNYKNSGDYYFLKDQIYSGPLAFFYPKHSPWLKQFDDVINRLKESGHITKWYDDLMKEILDSHIFTDSTARSLTLHHLQGSFLIWAIGISFGLISFCLEFFGKQILSYSS